MQFIANSTEPTSDPAAITIDELFADYAAWCVGNEMAALSPEAFASEFDQVRAVRQLEGKIRKFGDRYYGI